MQLRRRALPALTIVSSLLLSACSSSSNYTFQNPTLPATNTLLSQKIHHVFIIQQENHSFDNYFGTFPNANGFAQATSAAVNQVDPINGQTVKPFKITDPDVLSLNNGRAAQIAKEDGGKMDNFLAGEIASDGGGAANEQYGLTAMSYWDCDTVPYLWMWANNFTLFDNYFEADEGPSTLGNIEIFAGQVGQTQASAHANQIGTIDGNTGVPIYGDEDPDWGPPGNPGGSSTAPNAPFPAYQIDQNYATMAVTLQGSAGSQVTNAGDTQQDFAQQAATGRAPVQWYWAEEGFVPNGTGVGGSSITGYVAHHNAPQYFGYIYNNPSLWSHVVDVNTLMSKVNSGGLASSGVYYIKGSKRNPYGWTPANPADAGKYLGDDDHPGGTNSDQQIAEAWVAKLINQIASSPYWADSAIIITWDDNGGYFDHVAPPAFEKCVNDNNPCGEGVRLPTIVISPYALTNNVAHDLNDASSIPKFIETVFGLPTLASLPFEAQYMPEGPRDSNTQIGNLSSAFDPAKLVGTTNPVPASQAMIPSSDIPGAGPISTKMNCKSLNITPVQSANVGSPPSNFQPQLWRHMVQPAYFDKND